MPARAIGTGTVSFGLVSIPVKVYATGESSTSVSFNMLHDECGTRLKQKLNCPKCEEVVSRTEAARGYEFAKGQYVKLSDEEYKALQEVASNTVELTEFVPADTVDPVYFEKSYYLGADKGGEKAYKLLAQAMEQTELVGLAKYAARGKQYLVMVRPAGDRLVMHQLRYADELKSFDEVPMADAPEATKAELDLAVQIIEQIARETFEPQKYEDEVKTRMLDLIQQKIDGQEISTQPEIAPAAQIIDLMEALKASLGKPQKKGTKAKAASRAPAKKKSTSKAKPAAKKKRAAK